ncbi:VIT1/CCC1 transporter family protein, partial [Patescibacteria group bacterium]|nr:VIT1/CCC1 transporter family protein [Patescibacteria group bacterium]
YIFAKESPFIWSIICTMSALFTVGSLRTLITGKHWFGHGLEMLLVGGAAASIAYGMGYLVKGLVGM